MKPILLLVLCLLTSCAGLQPNAAETLVGEWRYSDDIQAGRYVFNRDGTFKAEVVYHGELISKATGRWAIESGNLNYTYISDELDRIPAGATDQDRLLKVRPKFFIIEAADGKRRKYLRIW